MTFELSLILFFAFITKHFVFDFLYQPPYMWMNKGTFLHPGGLVHAGLHGISSLVILALIVDTGKQLFLPLIGICFAEFVIHYIIDYYKMNINAKKGWLCNAHNEFWILLGFDQYLHYLTYIGMIFAVSTIL